MSFHKSEIASLSINIATLGLVTTNLHLSLKILIWLTYVVCGSVLYLTGNDKVIWLPYIVGLIFYLRLIGQMLSSHQVRAPAGIILSILLFILYVIANSVFNFTAIPQVFVGYKAYIMFWSVALVIGLSSIHSDKLFGIWKIFITIASLQLIVCILQVVIVIPIRGGSNPWDAIVGTFGGNPFSGGNSGGMAIFLVFVFSLILSLFKRQLISKKKALRYISFCLIPILFAEVKVVVLLLPIVVVWIYSSDIFKKAGQALSVFTLTAVLSIGILATYQSMHYSNSIDRNLSETIDYAFSGVTDHEKFYDTKTGQLGRITAIAFWANQIKYEPIEKLLFGYGIAMSRSKSSVFTSYLSSRFGVALDNSSLVVMLWELGIVGVSLLLIVLISTLKLALKLRKNKSIPLVHRAFIESSGAGILLSIATLAYNKNLIDTPMGQLLLMWCIGNCIYWEIKRKEKS